MQDTLTTPTPLKLRLYVMMFLQYFVQGCFLPIIAVYLQKALGFAPRELGQFTALTAVGPLLAVFLVGQVVDRHVQTQRFLTAAHLAAGAVMIVIYNMQTYWPVIVLGTVYSVLYTPTIMLTNSLTFHHLKDREREFPLIRVFGTIGFIVPAWIIESLILPDRSAADANKAIYGIALLLAGIAGLVMGLYCLTLPSTLPRREEKRQFAPGAVLRMLSLRSFLVLVLVTFGIALVHKFFFVWNGPFVEAMLLRGKVQGHWVGRISSLGQIAEIGVMVLLAWAVMRFGFKWTMLCGAAAYMLRCLIFAAAAGFDAPFPAVITLVCLGQMLHGFCFACFMAAAYMYVDRHCPVDVRGSMQTFYGTLVIGFGFFVGGFVGGEVGNVFTTEQGQPTWRQQAGIETDAGVHPYDQERDGVTRRYLGDWPGIWLSSAALALVCLISFAVFFPPEGKAEDEDSAKPADE